MADDGEIRFSGRDFVGFRRAIAAVNARRAGAVVENWVTLSDLERIATAGSDGVLLIPADWLAPLAARGAIRPLDDLLSEDPPEEWPHGWVQSFHHGIRWRSQVWGIPFHDGPQLLIYRKDVYEDPGERRAYFQYAGRELEPPRTWDEFDTHARWFTRSDEGRWGTTLAGFPDGHNNVYDFVVQLRRFGGDILDADGLPGFGGRPGRRALAWLRRLRVDAVSPEADAWDSVESGARFARGEVTLMANWAGFAQAAAAGPLEGRVGCALLPDDPGRRTTSVNAFWVLALASGGDSGPLWGFVREAVSPRGDLETTQAGASGARLSTWRDPRIADEIVRLFEAAHESSHPLPVTDRIDRIVAVLSSLVLDVVWYGVDAEPRLRQAVGEARSVVSATASGNRLI